MTNLVLAKKKNQALLEMDEVQSAQALLEYYSERQPTVRGRPVYVQYSNHQHLKTEQEGQSPEAVSPVTSQADDRTVLRVIVDNMLYPVSIDVLKQIFSRYGAVLKIVTFSKNNFPDQLQALIQMSEPMAAQTAKFSLNGQNIYGGCCTLRIDFSKLTSLNVKYNNDKSRDYTNPTLPSGDSTSGALTIDQIGSPYRTNPAAPAIPFIGPSSVPGLNLPGTTLRFPSISSSPAINSVVLVSNLNEETVTPDALFTLFGVYGDVIRVKVLFNKKDNALVQYNDPSGAQFAIQHLNNIRVWGKPLKVTQSKHAVVQMPREGQQDAQLTKDYTSSSLHRFKKPNSKNHHNIYPPSATLHLSNIPPNVGEQTLRDLFGEFGTIVNFKFFR
ncbi:DgyrCDS14445 [Dimorphilus gyrociliatus]|uniref:DgyrCDS14445 n=1 Tax=Dimorphilus gyrociliatus TaxID=2664684 RepID=A0A7I8WDU5_9ANNE|nr:DgyrCDS14445 [Dimorphilus gyrociliatus]